VEEATGEADRPRKKQGTAAWTDGTTGMAAMVETRLGGPSPLPGSDGVEC
jgi:hypothetical protein